MVHFKSIQAGLLAIAALGISTSAAAETVDFRDNGIFSTAVLTEGNVTVTGSANIRGHVTGLGISGGVDALSLDPGETMTFSFATPVTDVVLIDVQPTDIGNNGANLNATFEAFDENGVGTSIASAAMGLFQPVDVSNILGVASMSSFSITMNNDAIRVGGISFSSSEGSKRITIDVNTTPAGFSEQGSVTTDGSIGLGVPISTTISFDLPDNLTSPFPANIEMQFGNYSIIDSIDVNPQVFSTADLIRLNFNVSITDQNFEGQLFENGVLISDLSRFNSSNEFDFALEFRNLGATPDNVDELLLAGNFDIDHNLFFNLDGFANGVQARILASALPCSDPRVIYSECPSGPAELLEELEILATGEGPGNSLADKIMLAAAYLEVPDEQSACLMLGDFLNQVRAQRGKKLTEEQADMFTSDAEDIIAAIGCD
jgi:hypothetical protein